MEILKRRILEDGACFEGGILKVDSFINHQMDPQLMKSIADEFVKRFSGVYINKIMTIEHSFTKDRDYPVSISGEYLTPEDHVLCIDDFLANGNAALGMIDLINQAGATLAGMGFIIEKEFQNGGHILREKGIHVESLAIIKSLENCQIVFK